MECVKTKEFKKHFWKYANQKRKLLQADESELVRRVLWGINPPANMVQVIL